MADGAEVRGGVKRFDVGLLVRRALTQVAEASLSDRDAIDPVLLDQLVEASLQTNADVIIRTADDMRDAGVSDVAITDAYIPAAARQLGDDWLADRISFAQTSIGSARLMGLLRWIGNDWGSLPFAPTLAPDPALIIVPEGEQHTLGAAVLAGQLRRSGVEVQLEVEVSVTGMTQLMQDNGFSAVLISATPRVALASLARLVTCINAFGYDLPVVIGGTILETDKDIRQATRADYAFSTFEEVLQLLKTRQTQAEPAALVRGR